MLSFECEASLWPELLPELRNAIYGPQSHILWNELVGFSYQVSLEKTCMLVKIFSYGSDLLRNKKFMDALPKVLRGVPKNSTPHAKNSGPLISGEPRNTLSMQWGLYPESLSEPRIAEPFERTSNFLRSLVLVKFLAHAALSSTPTFRIVMRHMEKNLAVKHARLCLVCDSQPAAELFAIFLMTHANTTKLLGVRPSAGLERANGISLEALSETEALLCFYFPEPEFTSDIQRAHLQYSSALLSIY